MLVVLTVALSNASYRADGDASYRYRLILPLSRPVNGHDYRVVARAFDGELGSVADWSQERRDRRWARVAAATLGALALILWVWREDEEVFSDLTPPQPQESGPLDLEEAVG